MERGFQIDRTDVQASVGEDAYGSHGERRISDSVPVAGLVLPAGDLDLLEPLDFLHREQVRSQWGDVRGLLAKAAAATVPSD